MVTLVVFDVMVKFRKLNHPDKVREQSVVIKVVGFFFYPCLLSCYVPSSLCALPLC